MDTAKRKAAVAIILRHSPPIDASSTIPSAEVLLIRRAIRMDDAWSGHLAFPGGRVSLQDDSCQAAAERETMEEVGFHPSHLLGRLDDLCSRPAPDMSVSAFVYHIPSPTPSLLLDPREVASAVWLPIAQLADRKRHILHHVSVADETWPFPAIAVDGGGDGPPLWGLTLRFFQMFASVADVPLSLPTDSALKPIVR